MAGGASGAVVGLLSGCLRFPGWIAVEKRNNLKFQTQNGYILFFTIFLDAKWLPVGCCFLDLLVMKLLFNSCNLVVVIAGLLDWIF